LKISILTLFPGICDGALGESIIARARERELVTIESINIRDFALDKHHVVDDAPYGGGQGMVMKPEPVFAAVESVRTPESHVILLSPSGKAFTQSKAQDLSARKHLILISGHYEGIDQRVTDHLVDEELSIGDYVLTNGTLAAAVIVDAVVRLIPGVLGDECSASDDSFAHGLLEHPQYTRPAEFRGWRIPDVLLSGNHAEIERWRLAQRMEKTRRVRPDLLQD
jgi:tRNA (guanine37-N1)-methyltransferase